MDNIDKIITDNFEQDFTTPNSYKNSIKTAFNNKENSKLLRKYSIQRIIATIITSIAVFSGVVYAGVQIEKLFKINGMDDQGIQTALENQYVQNIDMEYIQKEKVKFKVDYLMMDDINFDLVFNFVTEDSVDNYEGIALSGLKITDENNNQIYFPGEEQECWSKNIALMAEWWSVIEEHDNLLRQVVHLPSNNFPRSEKLYISFDNVILYNVNNGNLFTIEYKDGYKLEFDVSKQLSERKTIRYDANNNLIKDIKLTNSALALTIKTDKYIERTDNYTITDDSNNVYTLSNSLHPVDSEKMDYVNDENILIFNITSYNESNVLKLHLPNGNVIELNKIEKEGTD